MCASYEKGSRRAPCRREFAATATRRIRFWAGIRVPWSAGQKAVSAAMSWIMMWCCCTECCGVQATANGGQRPSGDQAGKRTSTPDPNASFVGFAPSMVQLQISPSYENATVGTDGWCHGDVVAVEHTAPIFESRFGDVQPSPRITIAGGGRTNDSAIRRSTRDTRCRSTTRRIECDRGTPARVGSVMSGADDRFMLSRRILGQVDRLPRGFRLRVGTGSDATEFVRRARSGPA